jgi:hypothetical protein
MAEETLTTLDGQFKRRFGDKLEDLVPDFADFATEIPFSKRPKLGDDFRFPVRVKRAQGFTFSSGGTAFTLNDAVPGKTVPAFVTATSYVMREEVAYDVAASATNNDDAFGDAFDEIVRDMLNSMGFHRELFIVYGQSDIGRTAGAGSSAASVTYALTTASSAIGLWLQLDGAAVDVYDPTLTTLRNSTGALVVSAPTLGSDGQTVSITLTGAAADNNAVQAGDAIVPRGWVAGSSAGVDKIVTNTGALFGINATTYPLWRANTLSASSAEAPMLLLTRGAAQQVQRSGRKGKRIKAFTSFPTWNDLNNNHAALRRFASSTKSGLDLGAMESITYYGPGVAIDISPSALVKNSEIFMGEWDSVLRVGATDLTFTLPGSAPENPKFFKEMENKAGFELRGYWRQALIPKRPASLTKFSGIVNSL